MPRTKSSTPKKLGPNRSSDISPGRSRKSQPWTRRKILPTASPDMFLLGLEPVRCLWDHPGVTAPPKKLSWDSDEDGQFTIYADDVKITPVSSILTSTLLLQRKCFQLVYCESNEEELLLNIAISVLPWPEATSVVEGLCDSDFSDFCETPEEVSSETTWEDFFKDLRQAQAQRPRAIVAEYQHSNLVPKLRGYQADAVRWMVERESSEITLNLEWLPEVAEFVPVRGGAPLLYNKFSKTLSENFEFPTISKGGILADEMGLGKTVITLALILKNKRLDVTKVDEDIESDDSKAIVKKKRRRIIDDSDESSDDESNFEVTTEDIDIVDEPKRSMRRRIRKVSDSSDDEPLIKMLKTQRTKNLDHNLNADEELQLVPAKPKQVGILRLKLNEWYESKLAEMSCSQTRYSYRRSEAQFRCICGAEVDTIPRHSIECPTCHYFQHASCVKYSRSYDYLCPACWKSAPRVESPATLIVTPPAIFEQWGSEIKRHTPDLKVFMYNGVNRKCFVQPNQLANFDIVVTTYPVLSAETLLTEEISERRLRNESRFLRLSSPLTCISWWRVVCDEAQLVESDVSRVNQMVHQLSATHRWSVTGTPIQRSIGDLFYLTNFIGLGPLDEKSIWMDFLFKPYLAGCKRPLLSVLNQIFWRSCKESVADELGLPEQSFRHHSLRFSAIEETFYKQEHEKCSFKFAEGISRARVATSRTLDTINKSTLNKLLQPLLNIRQACTHPQVVSGVTIGSATGAANQAELLAYLSRKNKVECEDSLRQHISALNGIAGLHCLRFEWPDAIKNYRKVFRLADEYQGKVKVDAYQRIHALTNAAEVLEGYSDVVPPTLRDSNLRQEAEELENNYRIKVAEVFNSSLAEANAYGNEIRNIRESFESAPDAWWVPVILSLRDIEREVIDKLQIGFESNDPQEKESAKCFAKKITTLRSVEVIISQWWKAIEKERTAVVKALHSIRQVPVSVLVEPAVMCHLRGDTDDSNDFKCDLCKTEKVIKDLECQLFASQKKIYKDRCRQIEGIEANAWHKRVHGNETKYSGQPHFAERTLIIVMNFARNKQSNPQWILDDSKRHARLLDNMKKEFKQIRTAWKELSHMVQSEDELEMSKSRLRFALPGEEGRRINKPLDIIQPDKIAKINAIDPPQIDQMLLSLQAESIFSLSNFKKKLGQMLYLQHLGQSKDATPDPCPICKSSLNERWCVLQCGHCFCIECIHHMCRKQVACPICREITVDTCISFVDTEKQVDIDDDVNVLGDFSTKVDAVVRTALKLLKDDPSTKILIFSTWVEVLKILRKALTLNHVDNLLLTSPSRQNFLKSFRDPGSNISVLLLPLKLGSKGLNLTEATHVFLIEPILNSAEELQAIGRVHRIGQTKQTVVHRFLLKGTIEEKIQSSVSEAKDNWTASKVTVGDLKNLFVVPVKS